MAKVWYLGHSCLKIEINNVSIITDPFIRPNSKASRVDFDSLKADYILVSHGHQDHTADLLELAQRTKALVISNFEIITWLAKQGYSHGHPMNHGGAKHFEGVSFKMTNAIHSSSFPDGTYAGNPAGFVISSKDKHIYFAGDTSLTMDMKLIGEEFDLNLAVLPIGDNFTMGIKDAVKAAKFVECNRVLGMHYDTFEPIEIDHEEAMSEFKDASATLNLLDIGEFIEL